MVWHSYMLNPRIFLEDSIRYGKMKFWRTGLPWVAINSCIDNESLEYSASRTAQGAFERITGQAWDSLNDSPNATVSCPKCRQQLSCPWTTSEKSPFLPSSGGEMGHGWADNHFQLSCSACDLSIDHEVLRAQNFRKDLQLLLLRDVPMPGTILEVDGRGLSIVG